MALRLLSLLPTGLSRSARSLASSSTCIVSSPGGRVQAWGNAIIPKDVLDNSAQGLQTNIQESVQRHLVEFSPSVSSQVAKSVG